MNKKSAIKIGVASLVIFSVFAIIFSSIVLTPMSSGERGISIKKNYSVGENVKLDLRNFSNPLLKIDGPSKKRMEKTKKNFFIIF